MSKELLKEHTYEKESILYCKHCDNKINIKHEKFSYNHGYHTVYTYIYTCECEGYKPVNPIKIVERD